MCSKVCSEIYTMIAKVGCIEDKVKELQCAVSLNKIMEEVKKARIVDNYNTVENEIKYRSRDIGDISNVKGLLERKDKNTLPCPYCGERNHKMVHHGDDDMKYSSPTAIECVRCGARSGERLGIERAFSAWNLREEGES